MMKDKIFLAHSSKDIDFIDNYLKLLLDNNFRISNFIYDKYNFDIKKPIEEQIISAIKQTSIFMIFLSSNSVKSKWVNFEIDQAIKNNINIIGINITDIDYTQYMTKLIANRVEFTAIDSKNIMKCVDFLSRY